MRFLAYKPPDSGPHCDPNGNQVISDSPPIAGTEGTPAIFGGFPRLSCRAVLTMSAYAYQEVSSLVLANMHGDGPTRGSGRLPRD